MGGLKEQRPPLASRLLLRLVQNVSQRRVPRGLPRIIWHMRGIVIGKGIRTIEFRNLFRMYCECDSYPIVMAGCGFVYRHMERVIGMILRSPAVFIDVGANVGFVTL